MSDPAEFARAASVITGASKVHVLLRKEDFDPARLSAKVVIVLDILFATTTIVTALAHGAREVIPATDEHDARHRAKQFSSHDTVLAGEKHIHAIEGFASPLPLALVQHGVAGKRLIYSTTNGTVALRQAAVAPHVYAACLLNGAATVDHILRAHPGESVLVVCSGSAGGMNLEDYYGAGHIVDRLSASFDAGQNFTDAAQTALRLYRTQDAFDSLISSRVGRIMERSGLTDEVRFAAQPGLLPQVAKLIDGSVKVIND
ncbi:MAG: 2-phosphosulfolactate phosphatase [Burkholderiales bacterium]